MRSTKTVNGKTTSYHYNNGILLSETTVDNNASNPKSTKETIRYYYADGKIQSLVYKKGNVAETTYFLTYNGQGDVIAIYRSSDSALIGTYEYDLWGKPVSVKEATKGIDKDDILNKNPIRYRGYHYDQETGFYYLKARYYDAGVRRFISVDDASYLGADGTIDGYNLYAYCDGNPVNSLDSTGHVKTSAVEAFSLLLGGVLFIAAMVAVAVSAPLIVTGTLIAAGIFSLISFVAIDYAAYNQEAVAIDLSAAATVAKVGVTSTLDCTEEDIKVYSQLHAGPYVGAEGVGASISYLQDYEDVNSISTATNFDTGFCLCGGLELSMPVESLDISNSNVAYQIGYGKGYGMSVDYYTKPIQILGK